MARGNHKSARGHEAKLLDMLRTKFDEDGNFLCQRSGLELPDCEVAPLGITEQYTINEDGERVPKLRLTHDQSFNTTRGAKRSVNDRVEVSTYTSQIRPSHDETAPLRLFPKATVPTGKAADHKVDCKSAYRRIHATDHGREVVHLHRGCSTHGITDDLRRVAESVAMERRVGGDSRLGERPEKAIDNDQGFVGAEDTFEPAVEMSIDVSLRDDGPIFDCYLDDMFGVCRDCDRDRLEAAVPFALHLVGRPATEEETFPRDGLLSTSKFLAEAKASERKVILGWVINTRNFTVSLPGDKHRAWTNDIRRMKEKPGRRASSKDLEALIGRLNHAAFVIPNSRPFLGRLYRASEGPGLRVGEAHTVATRRPLVVGTTTRDAARGYPSTDSSVGGQPELFGSTLAPRVSGLRAPERGGVEDAPRSGPHRARSLNALEFLAALVGVWVEHQLGPQLGADDVLLSQGDSTSATGWMAKSSFGDECPILLGVARELAAYLSDHGLVHYSQWFPGKENSVADVLSRDFALNDEEVSSLVFEKFAEQVPRSFRIVPLPEDVITSVGGLLRRQPKTQQLPTTPVPSATAAGRSMRASSQPSGTANMTRFLEGSSPKTDSTSSLASQQQFAKDGMGIPVSLLDVALEGRRAQFVPPSITWHRPTGLTNFDWERRTRILRVEDLDFRKDGRSVDLTDALELRNADTVSVTYRNQKNGDRGVTVTQHRTEGDRQSTLCPVRTLADLVTRVGGYEVNDHIEWESVRDRPINLVVRGGKPALISSNQILNHLRAGALLYGEERLGFAVSSIGTHSLSRRAATAMFIAGVPAETIQLIGRWKSQAFLRYIRTQVQQLTQGVASGMIEHPNFFTIAHLERTGEERGRAKRQRRGKGLGEG
ncbi:hypothetical protein MHU86_25257 [Fragilaria crotonensis]|nr:hypothetical protein MHU86_25257 [Fragilaria crotonensis]